MLKVNPGLGAPLPGAPLPLVVPAVAPIVGTPIAPTIFPAYVAQFDQITHANINLLSMLYNDTFGIVAGDNATASRHKLYQWITGLDV